MWPILLSPMHHLTFWDTFGLFTGLSLVLLWMEFYVVVGQRKEYPTATIYKTSKESPNDRITPYKVSFSSIPSNMNDIKSDFVISIDSRIKYQTMLGFGGACN